MPLNLDTNVADAQAIRRIVQRAFEVAQQRGIYLGADRLTLEMDLSACHASGCPLDLAALESAREVDLMHDLLGIHRHLDRRTGELRDMFLPRHHQRQGRAPC